MTFGIVGTTWLATGFWGYYDNVQYYLGSWRPDNISVSLSHRGLLRGIHGGGDLLHASRAWIAARATRLA